MMLSATTRARRHAEVPRGLMVRWYVKSRMTSTQSPEAKTLDRYSRPTLTWRLLSVTMPPEGPSSIPAAFARPVWGRTPVDMRTIWHCISSPSTITPRTLPSPSLRTSLTAEPQMTLAPRSIRWLWTSCAMSGSRMRGSTYGSSSTTVTFMPREMRAEPTSRPMAPAPTMTASFTSSMHSAMRCASSIVLSTHTFSASTPGMGGTKGYEPVAITRVSYSMVPAVLSRRWASRSMLSTVVSVRILMSTSS